MSVIPNELIVTLNTSIPGYQKIKYNGTMTIKDINKDDSTIRFDPLIKLNKAVIDKIPEKYRIKEFFNKGLFQSLLNYTNTTPAKNLHEATMKGYVDNNINITINTIFAENTVINIAGKPYVIADIQWTNGDWKIDTKIKKGQIESKKIKNPYLYESVIKDEIISGDNQLNQLSSSDIYGMNFTGTPNQNNTASGLNKNSNVISNNNKNDSEEPIISNNSSNLLPNVIEPTETMKINEQLTNKIINIYSNVKFYNLVNEIYKEGDENTKNLIVSNESSNSNFNNNMDLDKPFYDKSVNEIKIVENTGGGNCFFIAVCDAINYYNYHNQENKIIHGIYGIGTNLYTPLYLRGLVYKFLESSPELDDQLKNIAPVNANNLNKLFYEQLTKLKDSLKESGNSDDINNTTYIDLAKDIYKNNENFLVNMVDSVPFEIDNYDKPFKVIEKPNLKKYILSNNYWGNPLSIYAISKILQLNIIPITIKNNKYGKSNITIPFANFGKEYNSWNKYLFLYYDNAHFNLITFNSSNNISDSRKIILNKKVIFERNYSTDKLPIYILFSIFGAFYMNIRNITDKLNFTFFPKLMKNFENIIYKNIYNKLEYKKFFYPVFKSYFPTSLLKSPYNLYKSSKDKNGDEDSLVGGYINKNISTGPPYAYKMMKKEEDSDSNQLAYYISIDMELHPGTSLTPDEMKNYKCRQKWNSIRKAYANFTGKPYIIPPVYPNTPINKRDGSTKNSTKKYGGCKKNITRKK